MTTQTRPAAPIGPEQLRAAMDTLRRYKAGKAELERRILEDEQFWRLRHQGPEADSGLPRSVSAWLVNVILNRHADAIDNFPEPNCLPRAADDREEARRLSRVLPVILRQSGFAQVWSDCWWYKLKFGAACYGVFWDAAAQGGLGDVSIRKCDLLNLFWQPGITDLQRSRHVFHVELRPLEELYEEYPQLTGKLRGEGEALAAFVPSAAPESGGRALVVDWYYKRRGLLHYCKFVEDQVLFSSENADPDRGWYDHGKYPFLLDVLFPEEGSPCGYGYIDVCKDPQKQIDLMNRAMLRNTLAAATPRYFLRSDGAVNEEEFADFTRPFVHTDGGLGSDSILPITSAPLSGSCLTYLQMKIQELRETSGNTEANAGAIPSGVTAASAIAALQEAGGKLSRDMVEASYRSFEELCLLVIDLIRQFYDVPRTFRITGEDGEEHFASYDNSGLRPRPLPSPFGVDLGYRSPVLDIEVTPQRQSRYTKAEYNELALKLFAAGLLDPRRVEEALACLGVMDFKGREELMAQLRQRQAELSDAARQRELTLRLARMVDEDRGTDLLARLAAQDGEGAMNAAPGAVAASGGGRGSRGAVRWPVRGESPVTYRARQRARSTARAR